jgi:hypothetical protein
MEIVFDEVHRGLSKFVIKQTGRRIIEMKYKIHDFHNHPIDTDEQSKKSWRRGIIHILQESYKEGNKNHEDYLYCISAMYHTKKGSKTGEITHIDNDNSYYKMNMDSLDNLDFMRFDNMNNLYVKNFYVYIVKKQ